MFNSSPFIEAAFEKKMESHVKPYLDNGAINNQILADKNLACKQFDTVLNL